MAIKVNLKKYLKIQGRWQFVPVLKVNEMPKLAIRNAWSVDQTEVVVTVPACTSRSTAFPA